MMDSPNYKLMYTNIICEKYPDRKKEFLSFLEKETWSQMDVIEIENKLSRLKTRQEEESNGRYRSYDKSTILQILDYQKRHKYSNTQLAAHFKLSRNTIRKWKKIFLS